MRRLTSRQFETLPFSQVRWPSLALSAVAFGILHGAFWLPGIIAGLTYGMVAMRTGRLGEAIIAHCTTNALLSASVLIFGQWQLW
jgi:CAAX prenyl protease-like protein